MAQIVTALYDRAEDAQAAINTLLAHNFIREDISVVVNKPASLQPGDSDAPVAMDTITDGAGTGAFLGGVTGLIVGLVALAIPGIGPAMAAGPIAAALVGSTVGAVTGGLIGALVEAGLGEEMAHYYAEGVRRGGILVAVRAVGDVAEQARVLLNKHHPIDIEQRAFSWREQGWEGFDLAAEPHEAEAMARTADYYKEHVPEEQKDTRS